MFTLSLTKFKELERLNVVLFLDDLFECEELPLVQVLLFQTETWLLCRPVFF